MKLLSAISLAATAVMLTACADHSQAPTALQPREPALTAAKPTVPTANGPVYVTASGFSFQDIIVGSGSSDAGVNHHPQGKGTCGVGAPPDELAPNGTGYVSSTTSDNTTWFNPEGHATRAKFCQGTSSGDQVITVICTFSGQIPATYAIGSGVPAGPGTQSTNIENLNFHTQDATANPLLPEFVHYNAQQNYTTGKGSLSLAYTCNYSQYNGTATIDLTQFTGAGNPFTYVSSTSRKLVASFTTPDGSFTTDLLFGYRSRNDIPLTTP